MVSTSTSVQRALIFLLLFLSFASVFGSKYNLKREENAPRSKTDGNLQSLGDPNMLPQIIKDIGNRIVEENEIQGILLSDYFRGTLLKYEVVLRNDPGSPWRIEEDMNNMISLRKPLNEISNQMVSNTSFKNIRVRPFPRSTLLLQEYSRLYQTGSGTTMTMQFLSRDLSFRIMNLTSYVDTGHYDHLYEVRLNQSSLQSADCRDLTYLKRGTPLRGEFYVFCQYFRQKQRDEQFVDENERMVAVVHINKTELIDNQTSEQIVRQYVFKESSMLFFLDFERGFKYLKIVSSKDNYRYAYFLAYTPKSDFTLSDPVVCSFDTYQFEQMASLNETYREGEAIIETIQWFSIKDGAKGLVPLDLMLIQQDDSTRDGLIYYAMIADNTGVVICRAPRNTIGNLSVSFINCITNNSQVIPSPVELDPVSLFKVDNLAQEVENLEPFFYAICLQPPAIIEYDMCDPDNIQINKVYKITNKNDNYIGTYSVSVNNNYILHLLTNPVDNTQIIRVYCRNANFYSMAKFEIPLSIDTIVDFYTFPSMFFNLLVFRDERTISTQSLNDYSLVLNGTNVTLIEKYKNKEIQVIIYVPHQFEVIMQTVYVTFVDKYNTSVSSVHTYQHWTEDIQVFYNCGELDWSYTISDYVNGPNYNLTLQYDSNNQSLSYFNFENQDLKLIQRAHFNFSNCRINFLFPFYHQTIYNRKINATDEDTRSTILICINQADSIVSSYMLKRDKESEFEMTNEILMPGLNFIDYSYDLEERTIFLLAENPAYANLTDSIVQGKYEMHIFRVYNEIIWNNNFTLKAHNISIFSYNYIDKKCVFVEYLKGKNSRVDDMEVIRIYDFNFETMEVNLQSGKAVTLRNASQSTKIVKAQMSSKYILFTLTEDKRINLYLQGKRVEKVKTLIIENIVNFDIYDNQFLFIYYGSNTIDVYEIVMYMRLDYYMRLPLYKDYESFDFVLFKEPNQILKNLVRTYKYGNFHVLMHSPISKQTQLFVFCVETNQHNSFIITKDFSSQFNYTANITFQRIFLTGEVDQLIIGTITDNLIQLFDAKYANKITLRPSMRDQLIERCKDIKIQYSQGLTIAWAMEIDQVKIWPESLFLSNRPEPQKSELGLQMRISSINQGMVPSAKSQQDRQVSILFSSENSDTSGPYTILHETYLEGQALNYEAKCNFKDKNGMVHDCTNATVEETRDAPYSFPIEFATSSRTVKKSFTLGQLYFMFDSLNQLIVSRLPLYQNLLDGVDGMALIKMYQGRQSTIFGCNLDFFSDTFKLVDFGKYFGIYRMIKDEETGELKKVFPQSFLMFYHCVEDNNTLAWDLKTSLINVYPIPATYDESQAYTSSQSLPFDIFQIYEKISIPQDIIDIEVFNLKYQLKSQKDGDDDFTISKLQFSLAISCEVPMSYSNTLLFYGIDLIVDNLNFQLSIYNCEPITAHNLKLNTFKIGKLLSIRRSNLLVGILEDYGAMIFNMTKILEEEVNGISSSYDRYLPPLDDLVLATIRLPTNNSFEKQYLRIHGPIQVMQVSANLPHTLTFITNWGLLVLNFPIDLTNTTQIRNMGYRQAFHPNSTRHLNMDFDSYGGELASNEYGSVFLVEKQFYGDNFITYLVALSYFSAMNTRIFKIVNMTQNEHCFSLNLDSYYVSSPEDQIAVSFICNANLQIYRVCMRPHLVVDLEPLARQQLQAHNLDSIANNFEITIEATNVFTEGNINRDSVNLEMVYVLNRNDKLQVFFGIGAVIGCTVLFLIIYIDMKMNASEIKETKNDEDKLNRNASILRSPFSEKNLHSSTYHATSHASSTFLRGTRNTHSELGSERLLQHDLVIEAMPEYTQTDYALNRTMTVDTFTTHPSFVSEMAPANKQKVVSAYQQRQMPASSYKRQEEGQERRQQQDDDDIPRFPDLRLSEREPAQVTRKSRATAVTAAFYKE